MALRIYEKARPGYHSVSRNTIDEILGWRGDRCTDAEKFSYNLRHHATRHPR